MKVLVILNVIDSSIGNKILHAYHFLEEHTQNVISAKFHVYITYFDKIITG